MRHNLLAFCALSMIALPLAAGCNRFMNKVWVERSQELDIPAADLDRLAVLTHNGKVSIAGQQADDDIHVTVHYRAGARTAESANECLGAIELASERVENTHRLAWKWSTPKHADWQANVGFNIEAPARLATNVETHNGRIDLTGLAADAIVLTHNGDIIVREHGGALNAETHNGAIKATCEKGPIELVTHNGAVTLDAKKVGRLTGKAETHNGAIDVHVGADTSTELTCRTSNGGITWNLPFQAADLARTRARGTIGKGGAEFHVETHNGSIRIDDGD